MSTVPLTVLQPRTQRRLLWPLLAVSLLAVAWLLAALLPEWFARWPEGLNFGLRDSIDDIQDWVIFNRKSHWLFGLLLDPFSALVDGAVRALERAFQGLPWLALVGLFAAFGMLLRGARLASVCAFGLLLCGWLGLQVQSVQTLSLMLIAVFCSLLIGLPLGVFFGLSDRADRLLRPLLDAAQTMPAFVYLIPVVLFFGIARVPAVIATMIYAVPPVIRLVSLGIREVPLAARESADAFGATRWQKLLKVQLPMSLNVMLAGINQTIMMALGMVVIAAMVGAGGLGREVYTALQRLKVGDAFEAGLAIVALAIVLDRLSEALGSRAITRQRALLAIGMFVAAWLLSLLPQVTNLTEWRLGLSAPVDALIAWIRANFGGATSALNDGMTIYLLNPMRELFLDVLPWPFVVAAVGVLGGWAGGWRMAVACALGMLALGALGMWEPGMDTLSQILVAVPISVLIALPFGVLASQYGWLRRILRVVNDFLQTIPTFVYLVPVIMLFDVGRVPGLIASALYAIPVGIKLIELGLQAVAPDTIEAARAFGSSRAQIIRKVQVPMARVGILLAVNQMIMMVLAMVCISGMVGGDGLGLEAVIGLAKSQTGRGIEAGLAIVILAIIMDRVTQAVAARDA